MWVKEFCPILCLQYWFRNHHIEIHWDKKVPNDLGEADTTMVKMSYIDFFYEKKKSHPEKWEV